MDKSQVVFPSGNQPRFVQAVDAHIQAVGDPDEQGMVTVEGEAAKYGNWFPVVETDTYQILRRNNAGMFERSLSQNPDIALRINHEQALARTGAGTLEVWETAEGLLFRGQVNTRTQVGNDIVLQMRDGLVTQGSVMYWPTDLESWSEEKEGRTIEYQDVRAGKLQNGDVSVVIWGANPQCSTTVAQMVQMATTLAPPAPPPTIDDLPPAPPAEGLGLAREQAQARLRLRNKMLDHPTIHRQVADGHSTGTPQASTAPAGLVAVGVVAGTDQANHDTERKLDDE